MKTHKVRQFLEKCSKCTGFSTILTIFSWHIGNFRLLILIIYIQKVTLKSKNPSPKNFGLHTHSEHCAWRGIYTVIEKTSNIIYKLRKKGGRIKSAHINRIKYYDPENSDSDKDTHISNKEDEEPETQLTGTTTRSRDNTLPPAINRFTATVNTQQDGVTHFARQPPVDLTSLWGSNNTQSNNATFATEFKKLFTHSHN